MVGAGTDFWCARLMNTRYFTPAPAFAKFKEAPAFTQWETHRQPKSVLGRILGRAVDDGSCARATETEKDALNLDRRTNRQRGPVAVSFTAPRKT